MISESKPNLFSSEIAADIRLSVKSVLKATYKPGLTIQELHNHPRKLAVAFWINLIFGLMYTTTVLIYYFVIDRIPTIPPWIPIASENYYLFQALWTIPWGLATWVMISGICHLLALVHVKDRTMYAFEDALMVCGLGWIVPNLVCMWLPETLLVPFFGVFWQDWLEVVRIMVIPPLWQVGIVAYGLHITHDLRWARSIAMGVLSVTIFFIMFLAFMR